MGWFGSDPLNTFKNALIQLKIETLKTLNIKKGDLPTDLQTIIKKMDKKKEYDLEDYLFLMFVTSDDPIFGPEKKCDTDTINKIVEIFNYLLPFLPIYPLCNFWDRMRRFERSKGCNIQTLLLPSMKKLTDEKKQLLLKEIRSQRNDVNKYLYPGDIREGKDIKNLNEFDLKFNPLIKSLGGIPPPAAVSKIKKTVGGTRKKCKPMRKNRTRK
jgi:hypothetical protein